MGKFRVGDKVIVTKKYSGSSGQVGIIVAIDGRGDYYNVRLESFPYREDGEFHGYFGDEIRLLAVANTALAREIHKGNIEKITESEIFLKR